MHEPAIEATTTLTMADAEARLREALKGEGFGVLTEVNVQSVLKDRIDVDVEPYRILGVCNPKLAHAAISIWKGFGLIAPCNVALYDVGDHRVVAAFDPAEVPEVRGNAELYDIARQASSGIRRAVASLDGT
ncbi:MAG: DUF302 domain-containing protein [Dehalococcoidia bacterium]|nr:MAG: DUF302 domain-containing protein [Dehalococcoidia bacterium]